MATFGAAAKSDLRSEARNHSFEKKNERAVEDDADPCKKHIALQKKGSRALGRGIPCNHQSLSSLRTAMNASVGTCTVPRFRIFFLPSFCFSSSFFLRVISPP